MHFSIKRRDIGTIIAAACMTLPCAAQAAPLGSAKGLNVMNCEVWSQQLSEGHVLNLFRGKGIALTAPGSPDHMALVECAGTIENKPDRSYKASGYCVLTDIDGDKWLDRWWVDSTMPKGRWEDTGISGKWKDLRRTGTYVYQDRSTSGTCQGVSTWEADSR